MKRKSLNSVGSALSLLVLLGAKSADACGTGESTTVSSIPTLGGLFSAVGGVNQSGQITGVSLNPANDAHAFLLSGNTMTDLGTLLGGTFSQGIAVNTSGTVVGSSDNFLGETHAFKYDAGSMIDLGTLGGSFSQANAVNDAGDVVGDSLIAGDATVEAFIYTGGAMTSLGTLGGSFSTALAINSSATVIGNSATAGDAENHGFVYSGGVMTDLQSLGGGYSDAAAINNANLIVGESSTSLGDVHAYVYQGGLMSDLGTLGGNYSSAWGINTNSQIIGESSILGESETHAFVYTGGVMTDLGTLGGNFSSPSAINNLGQVVGVSATTNGANHGFLYRNGTLTDLNTLLAPASGWVLFDARYISDSGVIIGSGELNGVGSEYVLQLTAGANNPPVAVAGADQSVSCGSPVTVDGSASSDPDNDALSFEWSENAVVLGTNASLTVSLANGSHPLKLKVSDPCGDSSEATVNVSVTDNTNPSFGSVPGTLGLSVGASCTAALPDLTGLVSVSDNCSASGQLVVSQSPVAGTLLAKGSHTVTFTVTDESNNSASANVTVNVTDSIAPSITGSPAPINIVACSATVPNVTGSIVASDNCTAAGNLVITQNPPAGSSVPTGSHTIVVTVADESGNSSSVNVTLNVTGAAAPIINTVTATPNVLTPPNNKLIDVAVSVNVTAGCDPTLVTQIISITANGSVPASDMVITGPLTAKLMTSKNNGGDRVYTITVRSTDASGNSSTGTVNVTVPKNSNGSDGGKKNK